MSSEWDHTRSLLLISKYRTHEALWNANNKSFHNPKLKEDAWWSLSNEMGAPREELKKKMECLRGSYRRERSRVRTGLVTGKPYTPKWFAYHSLAFLEESRPQDASEIGSAAADPDDPELKVGYLDPFGSNMSDFQYEATPIGNAGDESYKLMDISVPEKVVQPVTREDTTSSFVGTSTELPQESSAKPEGDKVPLPNTDTVDKIEVVNQKFRVSQRKIGFCGKGPFKTLRLIPKLKKRKLAAELKLKENAGLSSERPLKRILRRMEKLEDEGSSDGSGKPRNFVSLKPPKAAESSKSKVKRAESPLQKTEEPTDECAVFGQLVESTLKQLSSVQRVKAKMKLSKALWEIELDALNDDSSPESGSLQS